PSEAVTCSRPRHQRRPRSIPRLHPGAGSDGDSGAPGRPLTLSSGGVGGMNRTPPRFNKPRLRRVLRVGLLAAFVYLAVLAVLLCLENFLLYPAATFARPWREPRADLGVRDIPLTSS